MPFTKSQIDDIQDILSSKIKELFKTEEFLNIISTSVADVVLKNASKEIEELNAKVIHLERENKSLQKEVVILKKEMDSLEQCSRRRCLRIFGIKESGSDDPENLVLGVFNGQLKLALQPNDIERVHRIGPKLPNNQKPRPIIVLFHSYKIRQAVFSSKKLLKNSGITIREDLTKYRLQLLQTAAKKFSAHNTWTIDGKIFVKYNGKIKAINTSEDI
uniref:L1 transposable element RRM domain-containing protein n=1 Tax=Photinus pyralis TaxID=7054 RepID=A0A1Y1JWB7_PHOPY